MAKEPVTRGMRSGLRTGGSILVVDDDKAIRELLRLHLENAGFRVVIAPDAVVAGKHLLSDAKDISLLIVDAHLPYMSGLEFASTIIADSTLPPLPIILISGYEDTLDRALRLDVPCLVKPFTADQLIALVEKTVSPATSAAAGTRPHAAPRGARSRGREAA